MKPDARKGRLLVIEDDPDISGMVEVLLRSDGYEVLSCGDAEAGLKLARRRQPDLFLVDVALPGMDGFELVSLLRRETRAPIIFMTARTSETDRVVGFKLGADDYVTKPFFPAELSARVQAVLNRCRPERSLSWRGPRSFGLLTIDLERHDVRVNGKLVVLAPREYELLRALVEAEGRVVSRQALLEKVWGMERDIELTTRT
ncbi:MAG: response regulator transcription factor, partial [Elusimicrobia bacterium]|nr:response regulator transcription factor [Elusimicrobiota bacterium]